jgi:hypothetical protein
MKVPLGFIVISGESNSGGYGENSLVPSGDLGDRPSVKILNNTTFASFDTVHISTIGDGLSNTHVLHAGTEEWGARHGWELGLADMADNNLIPNPIKLVKTGQGGTVIADWAEGATSYLSVNCWQRFKDRVDAAIALTGKTNFCIFYSQGVNDWGTGVNVDTWKAATIAHFAKIRARYGNVPIVMTKLMASIPSSFNTRIEAICSEVPNTFFIETSDLPATPNIYHWNYPATITIPERMVEVLNNHNYKLT